MSILLDNGIFSRSKLSLGHVDAGLERVREGEDTKSVECKRGIGEDLYLDFLEQELHHQLTLSRGPSSFAGSQDTTIGNFPKICWC